MKPNRDIILQIATVAWWKADLLGLGPDVPPDEYAGYARRFADEWRLGEPALPLIELINAPLGLWPADAAEAARKIAATIDFGLIQWGEEVPDLDESTPGPKPDPAG